MNALRRVTPWLLLLVVAWYRPAAAQPPVPGAATTDWNNATVPGTAATNNWTSAGNWTAGLPDVNSNDFAVVNNGGVAYVNSAVSQIAGGVSLGTNANESGTLDILSGGSLTVMDDGPTFPADGSVRIGQAGTGTLFVRPGGTLTSDSLMLGAASTASSLTLGGAVGTTTVNTGAVTLGRTTRVTGPSVNFSSTGTITLQDTSTLIAEITGANHSPLKTTSTAILDGTLQLDFAGFTPTIANSWNLLDAASISGSFDAVVPDASILLGPGQTFAVRTVNGGTNGRVAQLYINQLLVLNVNRNTGAVSITNPGTSGISLDGYGILSTAGSLNSNDAVWNSLQEQPGATGGGWFEANATANHVAELKASGTSTLGPGQSWSLGNIFDPPTPSQFGQNLEDLAFTYTDPDTGSTANLTPNYTGTAGINNIVLFVDPASGNVKMRNTSPFTVEVDGYTVTSAAGSLRFANGQWSSLDDQNAVGGAWFEAGTLSANRVSELQSSGTTAMLLNGGTTFDLGSLYNTAMPKDLVFDFLLPSGSSGTRGTVVYEALPEGVDGDYNDDGIVNAADYTLWRDNLGGPGSALLNRDPGNTGPVNQADYTFWKSRFGATSGSGASALAGNAVPEPGAWALVSIGGVLAIVACRDRRHLQSMN